MNVYTLCILYFAQYRDNSLYVKRLFEITRNKINNRWYCAYCKGGGYIRCCDGCWRCNHSTLMKCFFCSGNGKGKYAYRLIK